MVKYCPECNKKVKCKIHGNKFITEFDDENDGHFYSCDKCVIEHNMALGSIVHWCCNIANKIDENTLTEIKNVMEMKK